MYYVQMIIKYNCWGKRVMY